MSYQDNETAYADANNVLGDIVVEQTKQSYDTKGNVWLARHFRRFDGLSGTGELNDPSGADPNALVTYTVNWYDALGRTTTTAFYGTNGNTPITTQGSAPAPNSSDSYIVTQYEYDANTGRVAWTKDNKARKTVRQYDDLGRTIAVIENYDDGNPTTGAADKDRTTTYTFDAKGRQALITAKAQSSGDDQKTYYFFCDTDNDATNNNMAGGSMVTAVAYPDTTDTVTESGGRWSLGSHADCVLYAYDRLGRKTGATDQRQVVHAYAFSTTTGALLSDTVTFPGTLPASLDDTIKKIGYTYDDFGRATKVTSYSDTSTTIANEVAFEYGPWGAVTKSTQNHTTGTASGDPNVQYAYEDGSGGADLDANFVRPDYVTYPGPSTRRVVYYNYPASGVGAALGRLDDIADDQGDQSGRTRYAAYGYLGAGTMVKVQYPAVSNTLTLAYGSRQDRYVNLDRFGRVLWQRWLRGSTVADAYFYGYDRTGNRKWRAERSDAYSAAGKRDEAYVYDGLDRLVGAKRGILPSGTYQAPHPGDATKEGIVNYIDWNICYNNYGPGKVWTQGDFEGDGVVDANDVANVMANWGTKTQSLSRSWSWTLDPVGNWSQYKWDADGDGGGAELTQDRAHNTANEIAGNGGNPISGTGAANWVDPTYDAAGNMISGPQPRYETADANTQMYVYDAWNRLTKVYRDANCSDTIDDPSELVATYSYDGQNRRIRKVVENGESDITYDYYYNENWQVLEVRKGGSANPYEQYVWGVQYVDAPVVRFRDGNVDGDLLDTQDNTDSTLYYTYDGNFNVTAVVKPDGAVAERYTYDPYGQVTFKAADWSDAANQAKSAYDNEILYCGYRFDPESGLYQVRNRYLHSTLGRWTTNDPIEYGDGMNRYQYVGGKPIDLSDTSGNHAREEINAALDLGDKKHSGFLYYKAAGVNTFFVNLRQAIAARNTKYMWGRRLITSATAVYDSWTNTMLIRPGISGVADYTMVHETVHALDDINSWHIWTRWTDSTAAETLAYGAEYLLFGAENLQQLEMPMYTQTCASARAAWKGAWESLKTALHRDVWVNGVSVGEVGESGAWDVNGKLGVRFSCSKLRPLYEAALWRRGIRGFSPRDVMNATGSDAESFYSFWDLSEMACCRLECPPGLPAVLK